LRGKGKQLSPAKKYNEAGSDADDEQQDYKSKNKLK
jgi:hypothetical protein